LCAEIETLRAEYERELLKQGQRRMKSFAQSKRHSREAVDDWQMFALGATWLCSFIWAEYAATATSAMHPRMSGDRATHSGTSAKAFHDEPDQSTAIVGRVLGKAQD
jgi:hypothetical protein